MSRIMESVIEHLQPKKRLFKLWLILCAVLLAISASAEPAAYYGHFVGRLHLVPDADGVRMRLLEPYAFIDASGGVWLSPAGTLSDGASIPQVAKSFVGGSWDGPYRNAAVIHDVACMQKTRPWELVHLTFYHAMLASGVQIRTAKILYAAVYHFGPRWQPGGPTYKAPGLPSVAASELAERERSLREANASRARACPEGQYEQCTGPDMPALGVRPICICIPNSGGGQSSVSRMHERTDNVIARQEAERIEFTKLVTEIDQKGLTIEQIQRMR